jgi:hypothetical protein
LGIPFEQNVAIDHEPIARLFLVLVELKQVVPEYRGLAPNIKSATYFVFEKFCGFEMSRTSLQDQGFISLLWPGNMPKH